MELSALRSKTKYIVAVIIILLGCLFIYQFFLAGWLNEGNPMINFEEVNITIASSGNIVHLSDQDYKDFTGLKEYVENPRDKQFLGMGKKITYEQKSFIQSKYRQFGGDYLEYNGKYYVFSIVQP
jgi:hypothetical protein